MTSKLSRPQSYTVYKIEFRHRKQDGSLTEIFKVNRRYNDFELLHQYVKSLEGLKGCVIPDLPQKTYYGFKDEK